jgi:hypothetical protein
MAEVQTTYTDNFAIGYKGFVPSGELQNRISRTIEDSAGIGFGVAAYRGAGDHGCTATQTLAGAGSAAAGNVGTSTITASPTVGAGAKIGRYTITQLATSSTGALLVTDPDGVVVAHGVVGTAITTVPGITSFTVTNGGTATIGDTFYIDVTGNEFLGFTIAHSCLGLLTGQTVDKYQQYDNVAIMPRGPIILEAGGSVSDGADAFIDTDGNIVASSGRPTGGWKIDTTGVDGDFIRVVKR